ncbi:MAG TPA: hypothetical protein VK660_05070, partial [Xanthomonadaceae bacterium]|nr:hypothetical protein [Xanthomonadaceae bacterium]
MPKLSKEELRDRYLAHYPKVSKYEGEAISQWSKEIEDRVMMSGPEGRRFINLRSEILRMREALESVSMDREERAEYERLIEEKVQEFSQVTPVGMSA